MQQGNSQQPASQSNSQPPADAATATSRSTGDADLDARLAERLRSIEEKTGKKCSTDNLQTDKTMSPARVPAAAGDPPPASGDQAAAKKDAPADDDDADTASGPGSDDERWLNEQLGYDDEDDDEEEIANAVPAPADPTADDIACFFAAQDQEYNGYAQAGLVVRGLCGACSVEVLSDMPRFKVNEVYYHEECRDAAVAMGVPCDPSLQRMQAPQTQPQPQACPPCTGLNPGAAVWTPGGGYGGGYTNGGYTNGGYSGGGYSGGGYSGGYSSAPQGTSGKGPPAGKGRGGGGGGFNLAGF